MQEPSAQLDQDAKHADMRGDSISMQLMLTCRGMELALERACLEHRFAGPVHVSLGQESVAAGIAAVKRSGDAFFSSHRGHHHAVAWGIPPEAVLAEVIGHSSGSNHGLGGSMHIIAPERQFYGTNGIVGDCFGLALGSGLATSLQPERDGVTFAAVGDGAMGTGIVYESLNIAVLWRLPIVFICEDNGYAEMTPTAIHLATPPADRARAFGLSVYEADGTDVQATITSLNDARACAQAGQPAFVHIKVHRWGGHYVGDPARYRPEGEDSTWRTQHCPIHAYGLIQGWSSEATTAAVRSSEEEFSRLLDDLLSEEGMALPPEECVLP